MAALLTRFMESLTPLRGQTPVVAVVRLSGVIAPAPRFPHALNIANLAIALEKAFESKRINAVALVINSPGGAAAQSMLLFSRIRALADEKQLPVYAFAEDVAASGGYMVACAADQIYATESSIVGSIGVVSAGFGFQDLIKRLGIERRIFTAGTRKILLDSFKAVEEEEVRRLAAVQTDIHDAFKALVRQRRGPRLKGDDADLFSGEFWTGNRALALGLIDGIGDVRGVMRARFGDKVRLRVVSLDRGWRVRRMGVTRQGTGQWGFGGLSPAALIEDGLAALEARALWARFGL